MQKYQRQEEIRKIQDRLSRISGEIIGLRALIAQIAKMIGVSDAVKEIEPLLVASLRKPFDGYREIFLQGATDSINATIGMIRDLDSDQNLGHSEPTPPKL